MIFKIGIENGTEERTQAWVLDHPGCFAYGASSDEALKNAPTAIQDYIDWIAQHDPHPWFTPGGIEVQLVETWEVYRIDENYNLASDGYEVNAWFLHDWKPLTEEDIQQSLKLLSWSRADLMATVSSLTHEVLDQCYPNERWSIAGILKHVGEAEWWYMDRLGLAFPRDQLPQDPFKKLEVARARLVEVLPGLVGSRKVVGIDGEFWSPRKVLRRAAWHERDHTTHIRELLG